MTEYYEIILENIFVKLIFLGFIVYLYIDLVKKFRREEYRFLAVFSTIIPLSIVVIHFASFDKIYPYAILLDLYLCLLLIALLVLVKRQRLKISVSIGGILIILVIILPLSLYLGFLASFKAGMGIDTFYAIYQTNLSESIDFVRDYIPLYAVALVFLILVGGTIVVYRLIHCPLPTVSVFSKRNIFLCLLVIWVSPKDYGIYFTPVVSYFNYHQELQRFSDFSQKRSTQILKNVTKKPQGELHVVVIGESLNKHHMGLYGYQRQTTPYLSKLFQQQQIIRYDNAFSNHIQTMLTLALLLTAANQINNQNFYEMPSIIQVMKKAGFQVNWLTNQQLYGQNDIFTSILVKDADYVEGIDQGMDDSDNVSYFDGELLPLLNQRIANWEGEKNLVIFIHLQGSHGIYSDRYPKEFEHYQTSYRQQIKDSIASALYGATTQLHIDNYDNSVLYNDFVLNEMITILQRTNKVVSLTYLPDHSEDVKRGLGHNYASFTFDMVQIPLIFWLSEKYSQRYPEKAKNLQNNDQQLFSNDLIYDTLIGLTGIKISNYYNSHFDLTSKNYQLRDDQAFTLHGKKAYAVEENPFYKK